MNVTHNFEKSSTGGAMLVGHINGQMSFYVGEYFPVRNDNGEPWRVRIIRPDNEWTTVHTESEESAQKLLIAALTCMVEAYASAHKGAKHGKVN